MTVKFYLFGDSICFGQLVSHHLTWTSSLSARLSKMSISKSDVLIQNSSINGNTTRQALERISYDVTSHKPDVLLVQFGMNDCNYWETDFGVPRVSQMSFEANLIEIIDRAHACGVKKIFLATNHPSLKQDFKHIKNLSHPKSNEKYNQSIRDVAARVAGRIKLIDNEMHWVKFLNTQTELSLNHLLLSDGIHLSEAGHRLYDEYAGAIICDYFSSILK